MKKTEKLSILISIVLISLLAISAVSAADIDDAGSQAIDEKIGDVDTTAVDAPTDDVGTKESEPATADTTPKESEPATVGANPTTDVEKSFTQLNKTISEQSSSDVIYLDNHYRYDDQSESDLELQSGIVLKGKHVIDGQNNMIDAAQGARIFTIDQGATITLQNIIFKGAKTIGDAETGYGGAIYSHGLLTIINCTFEDNNANCGGALYSDNAGRVTIQDSTFKANEAKYGGAIYIVEGVLELTNSTFVDNKAASEYAQGGAIYSESQFTIDDCEFIGNWISDAEGTVNGQGGAIYVENDGSTDAQTYTVKNSSFENNFANAGGAIYAYGDDLEDALIIDNCYFGDNGAFDGSAGSDYVYGGAIAANVISAYINGSVFVENGAIAFSEDENDDNVYGGAISGYNSYLQIENSGFESNIADVGGAIGVAESLVSVTNSTFIGNIADYGGAIAATDSDVEIDESEFISNEALKEGGALYLGVDKYGGVESGLYNNISNSNFTSNIATIGGAIAINTMNEEDDWAIIDNCNFTANAVDLSGGAVFAIGTELDITDSQFIGNLVDLESDEDGFDAFFGEKPEGMPELVLTVNGGAISYIGTELNIGGSLFESNYATADTAFASGGAISATGDVTILGSAFVDNFADTYGGAIAAEFANLTIDGSFFGDNGADYGGAIAARSTNVTIMGESEFEDNGANYGGAIAIKTSEIEIEGDKYSFTSYGDYEGTTKYATGTAKLTGNTDTYGDYEFVEIEVLTNSIEGFAGNKYWLCPDLDIGNLHELYVEDGDVYQGIGIYVEVSAIPELAESNLYIEDTDFTNNSATVGGAIYIDKNIANANIILSDFEDNTAITYDGNNTFGGAIATLSPLNITYASFIGNTAVKFDEESGAVAEGGAIFTTGNLTISEVIFDGNDVIGDDIYFEDEGNFGRGTAIAALKPSQGKTCVLEDITLYNNDYPLNAVFYNIKKTQIANLTQIRETNIEVAITNNTKDNVTLSIIVTTNHFEDYGYGKVIEVLQYAPVNITFINDETGKEYKFNNVTSTELFTTTLPIGNYTVIVTFDGIEDAENIYGDHFSYDEGFFEGELEVLANPYTTIAELEEALDKTIKELEAEIAEKNAEIDALKEEKAALEAERDAYKEQANADEIIIAEKNAEIAKKNEAIAKLQNETQDLNKQLNETKAKLNDANTANAQLTGKVDEANKALAQAQGQVTTTTKELASTQTTLTNTQNQLNTETKKANDANAKIKKVKAPKKVKKSKKLKITVTLNKKVKGKYVYVVFNGKAYKAKTNKKGVAKVTIKKSALKKLGGKKVKFQVIFNQSLKNQSVKVKK